MANTGTAGTSYTHTGLAPSTTRHYRVAAINAEGTGSYSSVARGTTNRGPPSAPQSLGARADGPRSITLSWTVPSSNGGAAITGYRIQRRAATSSSWITVRNTTNSTAITFQDSNLQPAIAYRYRVAAINSVGASGWSLEAGTRTHADVPGAPTNLTARAVSTSRINLSWSAPRNNGGAPVVGYRIEGVGRRRDQLEAPPRQHGVGGDHLLAYRARTRQPAGLPDLGGEHRRHRHTVQSGPGDDGGCTGGSPEKRNGPSRRQYGGRAVLGGADI